VHDTDLPVQSLSDKIKGRELLREQLRRRPSWPEIVAAVEQVRGGRDLALYLGRRFGGLTLSALGKLLT
jgi:hypothetical protein